MLSTERLPQAVVILKDSCGRQINSSSFSFNTKDVEQQIKKLYKFALVSDLCLMLIMLYDHWIADLITKYSNEFFAISNFWSGKITEFHHGEIDSRY